MIAARLYALTKLRTVLTSFDEACNVDWTFSVERHPNAHARSERIGPDVDNALRGVEAAGLGLIATINAAKSDEQLFVIDVSAPSGTDQMSVMRVLHDTFAVEALISLFLPIDGHPR